MHSILVRDYMDNDAHTIPQTANVREVVAKFLKEKIAGAPVIDAQGNLMGYVSEQDCVKEMLNDAFYCDEAPSVKTVMVSDVDTVTPDTSIVEIAQTILKTKHSNYPVVVGDKLVGMICRRDILQALVDNNQACFNIPARKVK